MLFASRVYAAPVDVACISVTSGAGGGIGRSSARATRVRSVCRSFSTGDSTGVRSMRGSVTGSFAVGAAFSGSGVTLVRTGESWGFGEETVGIGPLRLGVTGLISVGIPGARAADFDASGTRPVGTIISEFRATIECDV